MDSHPQSVPWGDDHAYKFVCDEAWPDFVQFGTKNTFKKNKDKTTISINLEFSGPIMLRAKNDMGFKPTYVVMWPHRET